MPTKIEWTDESWQVTHGCAVVSPGCTNCYAMRMAARLERMVAPQYAGLTQPSKAGPVWNGTVREADLGDVPQPLRWKKPRRIFVNSMSDLFHKDVSARHIAHVFGIMACAQRHTFQVLTKRPDRMAELLASAQFGNDVIGYAGNYAHLANGVGHFTREEWVEHNQRRPRLSAMRPLPNVWLGTSVGDQPRADERIPHLQNTPAAVRFLSVEPMLGPVCPDLAGIDLVIVGGESGPRRRPMDLAWPRALRDQCTAAGVAFFGKQFDKVTPLPPDLMVRQFPAARATPNASVTTIPQRNIA